MLGEGSFGEVWMCLEVKKRELAAVKFVKIKGEKDDEKRINNICNFLVEKEILEKISLQAVDCLARIFGAFYSLNKEGEIENLILASESGDYSIDQLINARKEKFKSKSPYAGAEALAFLAQISEGFKILENLGIYHSDCKVNCKILIISTT